MTYCSWYGNWWLDQANRYKTDDERDPLLEGLSAYAFQQANIRFAMKEHFTQLWLHTSIKMAQDGGDKYFTGDDDDDDS